MTQFLLATIASLTALVYSPASAKTDLDEDFTDFPAQSYEQRQPQQQYAARTECETHNYTAAPAVTTPVPAPSRPPEPGLQEKIRKALQKDCDQVRLENKVIICEDKGKCIKNDITDQEYKKRLDEYKKEINEDHLIGNEYYSGPWPPSSPSCIEWQRRERWRFNPYTIGKVDALLIDTQKIENLEQPLSFGYALRTIGKTKLYPLQTESTTREVRGLINYGKY